MLALLVVLLLQVLLVLRLTTLKGNEPCESCQTFSMTLIKDERYLLKTHDLNNYTAVVPRFQEPRYSGQKQFSRKGLHIYRSAEMPCSCANPVLYPIAYSPVYTKNVRLASGGNDAVKRARSLRETRQPGYPLLLSAGRRV